MGETKYSTVSMHVIELRELVRVAFRWLLVLLLVLYTFEVMNTRNRARFALTIPTQV